jgi:hypothetical protein
VNDADATTADFGQVNRGKVAGTAGAPLRPSTRNVTRSPSSVICR